MNVKLAIKKSVEGTRRLLLSGAFLGVYINILHTVPFMRASDFFFVFALIAFSVVIIPTITAIWSQRGIKICNKACLILKGMAASSATFVLIYLAESFAGNLSTKDQSDPVYFPISRAPFISLLISLFLMGLFISVGLFLNQQETK